MSSDVFTSFELGKFKENNFEIKYLTSAPKPPPKKTEIVEIIILK